MLLSLDPQEGTVTYWAKYWRGKTSGFDLQSAHFECERRCLEERNINTPTHGSAFRIVYV